MRNRYNFSILEKLLLGRTSAPAILAPRSCRTFRFAAGYPLVASVGVKTNL